MTDGRDKPEFRFNSTFTLHPGENDYGSQSLDECMLACVTSETLRIYRSVTQHTHTHTEENKYTRRSSAKCCGITSPNLVTFYRLLPVTQPPRDPHVALSHSTSLLLCLTHTCTLHAFTIPASEKLLSFLTLRGTLKCPVMASLFLQLKQMANAYKGSRGQESAVLQRFKQGSNDAVKTLKNA